MEKTQPLLARASKYLSSHHSLTERKTERDVEGAKNALELPL